MAAAAYRLNRVTFRQIYYACSYQQENQIRDYINQYPRAVQLFLSEILSHRLAGRTWEECLE